MAGIEPRAACMLGKHFANLATSLFLDYSYTELRQGDDRMYKGVMFIQFQIFIALALEIVCESSILLGVNFEFFSLKMELDKI